MVRETPKERPLFSQRDGFELFRSKSRLTFVIALVALYTGAIVYMGGLSFPLYEDERQFWDDTLLFSRNWPPHRDLLLAYPEPMTPGAFILWGGAEHYFGGGLQGARALNLALSLAVVVSIALCRKASRSEALLSATGLLLFPYVIPLGIHLYTDTVAAFFVTLGFLSIGLGRNAVSALAFSLAIATRQYSVAFPAALAAAECTSFVKRRQRGRLLRAVLPALGAATLLGWIALFGGLAPPRGIEAWHRHAGVLDQVSLSHGLYLLVCLGVYFVIPEFLLFRRWPSLRSLATRKALLLGVGLLILFAFDPPVFPPNTPGGAFGRVSNYLPDLVFQSLYLFSAWICCVRFARPTLGGWVVLANFAVMLFTYVAWEKYYLPILAALWAAKSAGALDPVGGSSDAAGTRHTSA